MCWNQYSPDNDNDDNDDNNEKINDNDNDNDDDDDNDNDNDNDEKMKFVLKACHPLLSISLALRIWHSPKISQDAANKCALNILSFIFFFF